MSFGIKYAVSLVFFILICAGAVYIYLGSRKGLKPEHSRVNSVISGKVNHTNDNKEVVGIGLKVEVNLTIYGHSDPDVLSYNASTEKFVQRKQVLEDIGREISHTYTVQNTGPSLISRADVTILWPTRDLSGNYLLYLVEQPIVRSKPGKGFCKSITLDDLNPLGLRSSKVQSLDDRIRVDSLPSSQNVNATYLKHDSFGSRERNTLVSPTAAKKDPLTIAQGKSCGTTNCTRIICTIYDLDTNDTVHFQIKSRFWKEQIELINLEDFQISSKMVALVTALPYDVDHSLILPYIQTVSTKIYVTGLDSKYDQVTDRNQLEASKKYLLRIAVSLQSRLKTVLHYLDENAGENLHMIQTLGKYDKKLKNYLAQLEEKLADKQLEALLMKTQTCLGEMNPIIMEVEDNMDSEHTLTTTTTNHHTLTEANRVDDHISTD